MVKISKGSVFLSFFGYTPPAPFGKSLQPGGATFVIGIVERGKVLLAKLVPSGPLVQYRLFPGYQKCI
jgi:hypothetical protein